MTFFSLRGIERILQMSLLIRTRQLPCVSCWLKEEYYLSILTLAPPFTVNAVTLQEIEIIICDVFMPAFHVL